MESRARRRHAGPLLCLVLLGCSANERPISNTWRLSVDGRDLGEVTLPADLGPRVGRAPIYRLDADVDLPPELRTGPLTLGITFLGAAARVYADGVQAVQLGEDPGSIATAPPKGWRLIRADGLARLHVRIEVENSSFISMLIRSPPLLSSDPQGPPSFQRARRAYVTAGVAATTILLVLIAIYGFSFLFERRREHGLAVLAMAAGMLPSTLGDLGMVVPLFGHSFLAVICALSAVGTIAGVHFIHAMLRLGPTPRLFRYLVPPTLMAVAVTRDPFAGGQLQLLIVIVTVTLPSMAYLTVRMFQIVRRPRSDQDRLNALVLLGGGALAVINVFLTGASIAGQPFQTGMSPGIVAFCLALALVLARDRVLGNREVQLLNQELRRQIGDRAGQLATALGRLQSAPAEPLAPGAIVEGRYRLISRLGAGGMGTVYHAERIADGRPVAIKVLKGVADREGLARLAREAQVAAKLDHPNLVTVLDVDVSARGQLFIVMELVTGSTLTEKQARYGDARWAVPILKQIAGALAAMHACGIVHRDLKPSNVLLDGDTAKVADFGLASLAEEPPPIDGADSTVSLGLRGGLTASGAFMGTPLYMAPELDRGARDATSGADMFSFGVVAYQLLAGHLPHATAPVLERLQGRTAPAAVPLAQVRTDLPAGLAGLVDRCLLHVAAARPTAAEVAAALSGA